MAMRHNSHHSKYVAAPHGKLRINNTKFQSNISQPLLVQRGHFTHKHGHNDAAPQPKSSSATHIIPAKKIKIKKNSQLSDQIASVNTPIRIHKSHQQVDADGDYGSAGHHGGHTVTSHKSREISRNKISLPRLKEQRHSDQAMPTYDKQELGNVQYSSATDAAYQPRGGGGGRIGGLHKQLPNYLQIGQQLTPEHKGLLGQNKTPQAVSSLKQVGSQIVVNKSPIAQNNAANSAANAYYSVGKSGYTQVSNQGHPNPSIPRTEQLLQQAMQQNRNQISASPSSFNPNQGNPAFVTASGGPHHHQAPRQHTSDMNPVTQKIESEESPQRNSLFVQLDMQLSEHKVKKSTNGVNKDDRKSDSRSTSSKKSSKNFLSNGGQQVSRKKRNDSRPMKSHSSMSDIITPQKQSKVNRNYAKSGLGSSYKNSTGNKGSSKKESRSSDKSLNRRSHTEFNGTNETHQNNTRSRHNRRSNKTSHDGDFISMNEQQNGFENSTKRVHVQMQPKDPRSQLNLDLLSKSKLLSECENSLEFILVSFCRAFEFQNGRQAFDFVSGGGNSKYSQCFQDMQNFSKINQFLSLLFTNLKSMIRILESENDHQNVKYNGNQFSHSQNSSQQRIMNLLSMGLSRSYDYRIVWQTCILLSGIFQNVNGIQINYGFQTQMIRWALNQNDQGEFMGPNKVSSSQQYDFIQSCLIARQRHQELNNVIIDLLYEVANMGRSKRKMDRQNDNSQLVELFSIILPKYFDDSTIHEYFELMHDLLESHHFQIEKDRIDKQHLLFKIIDKCLFHLSIINEVQDPRNPSQPEDIEKLQKSVNTRQSCMSLLCSIWSNNQQIFRQPINKFISNFFQSKFQKIIPSTAFDLFKNHMELMFDYNEYQMQTKVGKIVLLLLKRNLKDQNKLIKITTFSQLFRLLDQFTQREENDLQSVVFKLLVLQLSEQFQKQSVKDCLDVREIVSHYLASYIERNEKANIGFLVDTIREYGKLYLQKHYASSQDVTAMTSNGNQFPLFNMSDYYLMTKIINHPRTNPQIANSLLEFFKCVVLSDKFFDYFSLNFVIKYIVKLSVLFVRDLFQSFKSLFQSCCFMLTKLDIQILRLQNQIKKEVKHSKKSANQSTQSNDGEQFNSLSNILKYASLPHGEVLPTHSQLSNLVLKRHIIFTLALLMVSKSSSGRQSSKPHASTPPGAQSGAQSNGATREGLRQFAIDFLGKHLAKTNTSRSLDLLYQEVRNAESAQGRRGSSSSRAAGQGGGQLGQQKKNAGAHGDRNGAAGITSSPDNSNFGRLQIPNGHMQTMQSQPALHKYARNRDGFDDAANGLYNDNLRLPGRDNFESKSTRQRKDEAESANGTCIETINFVGRNQHDMNDDLGDQTSQTTLRTEIYTSEDEQEMMNYYGYINGQQRPGKSKTLRSIKQSSPQPKQPQVTDCQKLKESFVLPNNVCEQKSSMHIQFNQKQRIPSIKPLRMVADSPMEQTENNATIKNSEAIQSTQTIGFKRSNSSQFHQSIRIMDEKHVIVKPPKIPQAISGDNERPTILQRQNEAFARKRRIKNKKAKNFLKRQSSHAVQKQQVSGASNFVEQKQLPPIGHRTDREMFQNRLSQPKRSAYGPISTRMSDSNISIVNQHADEVEAEILADDVEPKGQKKESQGFGPQQKTEGTGRGFESGLFSSEKRGDSNTSKENDNKAQKKEKLRVDPNSNYMLKSKYVTNDLIPEESNEMSSKQILQEHLPIHSQFVLPRPKKPLPQNQNANALGVVSEIQIKQQIKERKIKEEYKSMIHPTADPNVMIISSKRGIGNTSRRSFNNSVIEQSTNENKLVIKKEYNPPKQEPSTNEQQKPQINNQIKNLTDQKSEQKKATQIIPKVNAVSSAVGQVANVQESNIKNQQKENDMETKRQYQKIDLPKDPNSGIAKKQIKAQQNLNQGADTPKAQPQQQLIEPQTKRSIQNSKPDILVGKTKKSWRGSQYNESHKSNQGSIKGGSIKQLSADDNNKESIVVKPQEIQQINKDIRFQMSYEMAQKAENDKKQAELQNKKDQEQKQKMVEESKQKQKEVEESKMQPKSSNKVSESKPVEKSESKRLDESSKRVDDTRRRLSEMSKPNEKNRSRVMTLDGNNIVQSQLDSLNDRGDSSEQALTPLEAANLQIEVSSPACNNIDSRLQNKEAYKSEIVDQEKLKTKDLQSDGIKDDKQKAKPHNTEAKPKEQNAPVMNQDKLEPYEQDVQKDDVKPELTKQSASAPAQEKFNTPTRVNDKLRKLLFTDEEAEKQKNATILLNQYENIIAKSQYDEEKSFHFKNDQTEKKDLPLLEDSVTNMTNNKNPIPKVESRTPQQNHRKANLDYVKREKVDADQSASQVNIPVVDSPHSESRSISKSPSAHHVQHPLMQNKPSIILQTPLNYDPRAPSSQQASPMHMPYSQYASPENQVQQTNQNMHGSTPNSVPPQNQHFNTPIPASTAQPSPLVMGSGGANDMIPQIPQQMQQIQTTGQSTTQQNPMQSYNFQSQQYDAQKLNAQAVATGPQFNYHDFMAQMQYLQNVQNDLMVKLKQLEQMKQMPNAQVDSQQMINSQYQDPQSRLMNNIQQQSIPYSQNVPNAYPSMTLESYQNQSQSPHISLNTASQKPAISLSHAGQQQSRQVNNNMMQNTQNGSMEMLMKPVKTREVLESSPPQKSDYNVNNHLSKSYMGPLRMATADEARTTKNFQSQANNNINSREQQIQLRRKHQQSALSTRSFVSSMTQQHKFQNTVAPVALSQYFDHQKKRKKRKVFKEFKETIKILNPSADQLETMSQKVSLRIQNLKKKKEEKEKQNASQLGSVRDDRSMKRRVSNLSQISNNIMSQYEGMTQQNQLQSRPSMLARQQMQQQQQYGNGNLNSIPNQMMMQMGGAQSQQNISQPSIQGINQSMQQPAYNQYMSGGPSSHQYAAPQSTSPYQIYGQRLPPLVSNSPHSLGYQTPNNVNMHPMIIQSQKQLQTMDQVVSRQQQQQQSASAPLLPNLPSTSGTSLIQQQQQVPQMVQSQQQQNQQVIVQQQNQQSSAVLQLQQQQQQQQQQYQLQQSQQTTPSQLNSGTSSNLNRLQLHHSPQPYTSGMSAYGQQIMGSMNKHGGGGGQMQAATALPQTQQHSSQQQMYPLFTTQQQQYAAQNTPATSNGGGNTQHYSNIHQQYIGGGSGNTSAHHQTQQVVGSQPQPQQLAQHSQQNAVNQAYFQFNQGSVSNAAGAGPQ